MMDSILIRDLELETIIGTLPDERTRRQKLILNLEIGTDLAVAGRSDDLHDSIDYSMIEARIKELVEASEFFLLEKLGETVCGAVLEFHGVWQVVLTIDKPGAPRFARSIAIRMTRKKPGFEHAN